MGFRFPIPVPIVRLDYECEWLQFYTCECDTFHRFLAAESHFTIESRDRSRFSMERFRRSRKTCVDSFYSIRFRLVQLCCNHQQQANIAGCSDACAKSSEHASRWCRCSLYGLQCNAVARCAARVLRICVDTQRNGKVENRKQRNRNYLFRPADRPQRPQWKQKWASERERGRSSHNNKRNPYPTNGISMTNDNLKKNEKSTFSSRPPRCF